MLDLSSGSLVSPSAAGARHSTVSSTSGPSRASGWQCLHSATTMKSCHTQSLQAMHSRASKHPGLCRCCRGQLLSPSKWGLTEGQETLGYSVQWLSMRASPKPMESQGHLGLPGGGNTQTWGIKRLWPWTGKAEGKSAGCAPALLTQQLSAEHLGQM